MNLITAILLAAVPCAASETKIQPSTESVVATEESFQFNVSSDWQVEAAAARRETDSRMRVVVEDLVATLAPELNSAELSPHVEVLLLSSEVKRTENQELRERPYGTMYRQTNRVELPRATLNAWRSDLQAQAAQQVFRRSVLFALTAATAFAFVAIAHAYDRVTWGYRRPVIAVAAVVVVGFLWGVWSILNGTG